MTSQLARRAPGLGFEPGWRHGAEGAVGTAYSTSRGSGAIAY
jgi:hypothetical protein